MKLDRAFLKQLSINEFIMKFSMIPSFTMRLINVCHEFFHFMNFSNGRSRMSIDPPGSDSSLSLYIQYITNMFNVICMYIKWFDTLKHIYIYIKHIYIYTTFTYIYIFIHIYIHMYTHMFFLENRVCGSVLPLV